MGNINYKFSGEVPVITEADVVVIGGGPGGLGAAVASSRNGADTLLIERYGYLGGMATAGEVHPFMANHVNMNCLDRPVYTDWVNAMWKYQPNAVVPVDVDNDNNSRMISKDAAMLAAEDLCLDAGVRLLYHHSLFDVIKEDNQITGVILFSKSGLSAAKGKIFIDCTGDGDLAAMSGCEFEFGNAGGFCQPMTLCFKLAGVEVDKLTSREAINKLYDEAKASGEIDCPRENVLWFYSLENDVIHFNTTRVVKKSGIDGIELSGAEIEGRRQLRQFLDFLRKHVTGFKNARIHSIAHHIGIRETRRIKGIDYIGIDAFKEAKKYPDAIAKVHYPIDIHNPTGTGTEHHHLPPNEWYEIPYGCIVAKDAGNLLVGGRPISVDHAVHSSMRVMPPACTVGQAAGTAAAMSVETGALPRDLDGIKVRGKLKQFGAEL